MSQLITGEAVTIDLRVARLGSRLIACTVDLSIEFVVLLIMAWVSFRIVVPDDDALAATVYLLVVITVLVGYPVTAETVWHGRTIGKAVMGLRVVRDDGGPIRFRHALVRGLLGVVVEKPGALLGTPAVLSMLISERSKRLGDILAGTVVLQERIPRGNAAPVMMPPQLAYWASTLDLSLFGDALALAVRQFLGRVQELSPEARERLGSQLVASALAVVTPPPPPGTPGWAYLSAVLAERTARAHRRLTGGPPGWQPGWQPSTYPNPAFQNPASRHSVSADPFAGDPYSAGSQRVPAGRQSGAAAPTVAQPFPPFPPAPQIQPVQPIQPVEQPAPGPFVPPS
ncbi:RDD family protein [Frankia sp. Cr2]|uniref:RDD family protein n=1 Tax=Frankia sp. Cr2 TaxID=3073932 RepID=UPI002AD33336|nr:RDD family protein [Frankia sp. Cr2]